MQKKIVLALLMTAFTAVGAFAQLGFSVGGGGLVDMSFNNGIKPATGKGYGGIRNTSFGGFIFFDVTYAELNVYFAHGSITPVIIDENGKTQENDPNADKVTMTQLGFSLLGKFPIYMGNVTFFPLLGIDYNIVLSAKDGDEKDPNPGYWNQFGFLGGVGADINITKSIFIRAEGLFHIRLPSKQVNDQKAAAEKLEPSAKLKTTWGMGPQIKLAVGFKF